MQPRSPSLLVKALVPVAFLALLATPLAQGRPAPREIRDSLRLTHLQHINRERAQLGLQAVRLDSFASLLADRYCQQQIRERTTGHFLTDGQPPYMRYSMAGGSDGISENAAAWSANYRFSDAMLPDLMHQSLTAMLAEVPPQDGHRRAILDPHATHVGIGLAWDDGEFRLAQVFVRRYVEWEGVLARDATTADRIVLRGRPKNGYVTEAISVHFEPHPRPISAAAANRIPSYSLPSSRRDYRPRPAKDGRFSFPVPFPQGAGVYTVVAWVRPAGGSALVAASNISIRVHRPQDGAGRFSSASR
jgi:uncharacterized protein YkwD